MNLSAAFSRIGKYTAALSQLNAREGWGFLRSIHTYFDYMEAFLIHGCLIDQYVNGRFYSFRNYYRKRIITQRRLEHIIGRANASESIPLLENKALFNRHFSRWVSRKWVLSESMTPDDFEAVCLSASAIFIKPLDAYEGKGIRRVASPVSPQERRKLYDELRQGRYIIEQELSRHTGMIFGNRSVNTLRINTLLDKAGNVHIFKPVLRAGIGDAFVDNYNAGGVEYAVDLATGVISMPGYRGGELSQINHPGTDIRMVGYRIPMWQEIIECVECAAKHIPGCRYVGWDVAVTPDGIELIEGNHNPGYVCMEYFGETGWYDKLRKYL